MAFITLTDDELAEVRLHLGNRVTSQQISDEQLRSKTIEQAASDYVLESILKDINVHALGDAQDEYVDIRDGTADESAITSFLNTALKIPQLEQFRRAVIYRAAGLAAGAVDRQLSEGAIGINQRVAAKPWEVLQASLFQRCDEEIERLRNAFPNDAFPSQEQRARASYQLFQVV